MENLIYVNPIGKNSEGLFEYEFFFSNEAENAWGENWDAEFAAFGGDMNPFEWAYNEVRRLVCDIPLLCIQNNSSFSMSEAIDGCVCLCYEDISLYESYPEPYRLVFHFGDTFDSVQEQLKGRGFEFS